MNFTRPTAAPQARWARALPQGGTPTQDTPSRLPEANQRLADRAIPARHHQVELAALLAREKLRAPGPRGGERGRVEALLLEHPAGLLCQTRYSAATGDWVVEDERSRGAGSL